MTFWKTFFASLLAIILSGILVTIIFFAILGAMTSSFSKEKIIEKNTVLHMKLDGKLGDVSYTYLDKNSFQIQQQTGLVDILNAITAAKKDKRIKGIYLNVSNIDGGLATVKEIRNALESFQDSGKFVLSYNENYSNKSYYLSSVAKEVYMLPSGTFGLLGLGAEIPFIKGTLEKLEVEMQIIRGTNNKFKSAVEPLIYDQMSPENREQTEKYLNALWIDILQAIEKDRGVNIGQLNEIVDSLYARKPAGALEYKLIDGVKYFDEIEDILKSKVGIDAQDDLNLFSFTDYVKKRKAHKSSGKIAVISLEGEIVDGDGEPGQIGGNSSAALIRKVRKDTTIKAVVLRVNSPGGSALASDLIWREIILTKAKKPVIVSMGDVAASGGYYVSCGADKIYAESNTITGSIGVFGIIPFTGDLMKNKLGVSFDRVQTNTHSVLSLNKRLTTDELTIIQEGVDDIYSDFVGKVASGRGMTSAEVDSIGQGRVWAGKDAIEIGLIDDFGGLSAAIQEAATRANIDNLKVKVYTTNKTDPMIEMMSSFGQTAISSNNNGLEQKIRTLYQYVKRLESSKGVQARMPNLLWIE